MIQKNGGGRERRHSESFKSVAGNPKSADAQGALGSLCLQAGDLTKAIPALEQAVLLAPGRSAKSLSTRAGLLAHGSVRQSQSSARNLSTNEGEGSQRREKL